MDKTIEEMIEERAKNTPYGLTLAQKRILKEAYEREEEYYLKEASRVDNNTGHDDQ